jgi:hypothetical protein
MIARIAYLCTLISVGQLFASRPYSRLHAFVGLKIGAVYTATSAATWRSTSPNCRTCSASRNRSDPRQVGESRSSPQYQRHS